MIRISLELNYHGVSSLKLYIELRLLWAILSFGCNSLNLIVTLRGQLIRPSFIKAHVPDWAAA